MTSQIINNNNCPMLSSSEFHSDFKAFKISIHEVGINGLAINRILSAEAFTALLKEPHNELFSWRALKPVELKFNLTRENDHVFKVEAQAKLPLNCTCVRCLEPVAHEICLDFAIIMIEGTELSRQDEDPNFCSFDSDEADSDSDTNVSYFLDRTLDLGLILREQIFLEAPDYPHCAGETALLKSACKPVVALISEESIIRENPFVKFWKTN